MRWRYFNVLKTAQSVILNFVSELAYRSPDGSPKDMVSTGIPRQNYLKLGPFMICTIWRKYADMRFETSRHRLAFEVAIPTAKRLSREQIDDKRITQIVDLLSSVILTLKHQFGDDHLIEKTHPSWIGEVFEFNYEYRELIVKHSVVFERWQLEHQTNR
jgi:hypothetical protein